VAQDVHAGRGGDAGGLRPGEVGVDDGERRAQRAWLMPVFTFRWSTSITQMVVLSDPVPVVVGTATSGLSGCVGACPPPTGALM
jgi:hypothetical protein